MSYFYRSDVRREQDNPARQIDSYGRGDLE